MFDISLAIILAIIAIALVSWFLRYKARSSEQRMLRMMQHLGLDPEIANHADTEAIIREVRKQCRRCQTEGVCERWLTGTENGDNAFCPNAQIFDELKKHQVGGHVAHAQRSDEGEIAAS